MMQGKYSELGKFLMEENTAYNYLFDAVRICAAQHHADLEFLDNDNRNAYVELEDIAFCHALNLTIVENEVAFDAVVEGNFSYKVKIGKDWDYENGRQWFKLHCKLQITDKLDFINITSKEIYSYIKKERDRQNAATMDLIPLLSKNDLETEAEKFLNKWYPKGLLEPIPIPIREIAEKKMGLKVIDDVTLTKDLSVFGQVCYNDGTVKVYDENSESIQNIEVKRGTVMLDPNTFFLRGLGCTNNTIAHEAYHWEKHRIYATVHGLLNKSASIAQRCPVSPQGNMVRTNMSSNEDWMEWQANAVAPKILMPKTTIERKIHELKHFHEYEVGQSDSEVKLKAIIDDLADFYGVSKQAAKIRMIELGTEEAVEVYNYSSDDVYISSECLPYDAFQIYNNDKEFRALFDLGIYRYAEGAFVINNERYVTMGDNGEYVLTDNAKQNRRDCTLQFAYNIADLFEFNKNNGVLYREREARPPQNIFQPQYNQANINRAMECAEDLLLQVESMQALGEETVAQTLTRYMQTQKWNSSIFQQKTGVNQGMFRKITTTPNKKLELPILVSICVGLSLPQQKALELIQKAGYALSTASVEGMAYNMILSTAVPKDILACNALIEEINMKNPGAEIRLLGSQNYKENKNE